MVNKIKMPVVAGISCTEEELDGAIGCVLNSLGEYWGRTEARFGFLRMVCNNKELGANGELAGFVYDCIDRDDYS